MDIKYLTPGDCELCLEEFPIVWYELSTQLYICADCNKKLFQNV